jgi:hypothetical protein
MSAGRVLERSAAAVWLVVAAAFCVFAVLHFREASLTYGVIDYQHRPGSDDQNFQSAPPSNAGMSIEVETGSDGRTHRRVTVAGSDIDAPLESFVEKLNSKLKQESLERNHDIRLAGWLDILGIVTALGSAYYEWRKSHRA